MCWEREKITIPPTSRHMTSLHGAAKTARVRETSEKAGVKERREAEAETIEGERSEEPREKLVKEKRARNGEVWEGHLQTHSIPAGKIHGDNQGSSEWCDSNTIIEFADDTAVVGLITDDNESLQKGGSETWQCCARTKTSPSMSARQKELIIDYRKRKVRAHPHQQGCSGAGPELQVPRCPHHQGMNYHCPHTPTQS
jgi:hypothetical protein